MKSNGSFKLSTETELQDHLLSIRMKQLKDDVQYPLRNPGGLMLEKKPFHATEIKLTDETDTI